MAIVIKNIILYDRWQSVGGFAELRTSGSCTSIKLRHSLNEKNLIMSVAAGGQKYAFAVDSCNKKYEIETVLNLSKEIIICLMTREDMQNNNDKVTTVASGAINLTGSYAESERLLQQPLQLKRSGNQQVRDSRTVVVSGKQHDNLDFVSDPENGELSVPDIILDDESRTADVTMHKSSSVSVILDETEFMPISRKTANGAPPYKTEAAREIDELLRTVCAVDDDGKGICETCPYREHFFGDTLQIDNSVIKK